MESRAFPTTLTEETPLPASPEPPVPRINSPVMHMRAREAAREARKNPGAYIPFGCFPVTLAGRIASRIKAGGYPAFSIGLWDATQRKGTVWVMFLGEVYRT